MIDPEEIKVGMIVRTDRNTEWFTSPDQLNKIVIIDRIYHCRDCKRDHYRVREICRGSSWSTWLSDLDYTSFRKVNQL